MTEIPEPIRRAMEAQARVNRRIDVAAVEAALSTPGEVIPSDEAEVLRQAGSLAPPREESAAAATEQIPGMEAPREVTRPHIDREYHAPLAQRDEGRTPPIRYENLLPAADVETFKRVKRWTMSLATEARQIIAELVGGTIGDGGRSDKEFVQTKRGTFRVAMGHNSDNTTEVHAHEEMGVRYLHLDSPEEIVAFFVEHEVAPQEAYDALVRRLRRRF